MLLRRKHALIAASSIGCGSWWTVFSAVIVILIKQRSKCRVDPVVYSSITYVSVANIYRRYVLQPCRSSLYRVLLGMKRPVFVMCIESYGTLLSSWDGTRTVVSIVAHLLFCLLPNWIKAKSNASQKKLRVSTLCLAVFVFWQHFTVGVLIPRCFHRFPAVLLDSRLIN